MTGIIRKYGAIPPSLAIRRAHTFALRRGWPQLSWMAAGIAAAAVWPHVVSPFWLHITNIALIAGIGAIGLNLVTGYARLVSLGQAAFLGTGGFTVALLTIWSPAIPAPVVLVASAVAGGILGAVVALPSLRLRVLYVAVTTLALHYGVSLFLESLQAEVLRSDGLVIPLATIGPFDLSGPLSWYYTLLVVVIGTVVACLNTLRSFVGRRWIAVADHDVAAEALGVSIVRSKLSVFVASSALVSFAGGLDAYYVGTVTFETYDLGLAILYLAMIIVGGIGSILGSLLGAFVITTTPYLLDEVMKAMGIGLDGSTLSGLHAVFYGTLIILFLLFQPRGLVEVWRRVRTAFAHWPFRYIAVQRKAR